MRQEMTDESSDQAPPFGRTWEDRGGQERTGKGKGGQERTREDTEGIGENRRGHWGDWGGQGRTLGGQEMTGESVDQGIRV